jgi:lipopolysaccharide export system protein LptC
LDVRAKFTALIVVVALSAGLAIWMKDLHTVAVFKLKERIAHIPQYTLEDITLTTMDTQGQPQYRIRSPQMVHYTDDETTEFDAPVLWVYRPAEPPMEVRSRHAWVSPSRDKIVLQGTVTLVQPQTENRRGFTVHTREVSVFPAPKTATTTQDVTVYGEGFYIEGMGGKIDMQAKTVRLDAQVRGVYEP